MATIKSLGQLTQPTTIISVNNLDSNLLAVYVRFPAQKICLFFQVKEINSPRYDLLATYVAIWTYSEKITCLKNNSPINKTPDLYALHKITFSLT